jgi:hypothetical protein
MLNGLRVGLTEIGITILDNCQGSGMTGSGRRAD